MSSFEELLRTLTVGDLLPSEGLEVQWAFEDEPIAQGIDILLEHKLHSIPLKERKTGTFWGFLDLLDIVHFALRSLDTLGIIKGSPQGFQSLFVASRMFETWSCGQVAAHGPLTGCAFVETLANTKLRDVLAAMVNTGFSYQRVPVVDENHELLGIVSQSRIIRKLNVDISTSSMATSTIGVVFSTCLHPVVVLEAKHAVRDALDLIEAKIISAIGIVDVQGKLIGNFSAADVKRFSSDLSFMITQSLQEFIETVDKSDLPAYPVAVQTSTTVEELFSKFDITGVHRVYIVDQNAMPIGVISTKDMIKYVLSVADGVPMETAEPTHVVMKQAQGSGHEDHPHPHHPHHHHRRHRHRHHHHHHSEKSQKSTEIK
jgi:CBS domain-containing protein